MWLTGLFRGTVVVHRSLAVCAQPAADWWPLLWVNRPLQVCQPDQLSLSSFRGRWMS